VWLERAAIRIDDRVIDRLPDEQDARALGHRVA
jgi:hypothetical protein